LIKCPPGNSLRIKDGEETMSNRLKRRDVLAGAGALMAAGRAFGQTPPPPVPPTPPIVFVTLRTEAGNIGMVLEMAKAPITVFFYVTSTTEKRT